jgi:hypothetical protein
MEYLNKLSFTKVNKLDDKDPYLKVLNEKKNVAYNLVKNKKEFNKFMALYNDTYERINGINPRENIIKLHVINNLREWVRKDKLYKNIFIDMGLDKWDACFGINPELQFNYNVNLSLLKIDNIFYKLHDITTLIKKIEINKKNYTIDYTLFYIITTSDYIHVYLRIYPWLANYIV